MRTFNFGTHWTTTDQYLEGAIESFEVTPEEVSIIEEGTSIESVDGIESVDRIKDAFYGSFDGVTLSNLITKRG